MYIVPRLINVTYRKYVKNDFYFHSFRFWINTFFHFINFLTKLNTGIYKVKVISFNHFKNHLINKNSLLLWTIIIRLNWWNCRIWWNCRVWWCGWWFTWYIIEPILVFELASVDSMHSVSRHFVKYSSTISPIKIIQHHVSSRHPAFRYKKNSIRLSYSINKLDLPIRQKKRES